jgi:hypothetical protein
MSPDEKDPKSIWQNQPAEESHMALDRIMQRKVNALHDKTRFELLGNILVPIITAAISGWWIVHFSGAIERFTFGAILLWAAAGLYFISRGMGGSAFPSDAGVESSLEFYRREIASRQALQNRVMLWSFGPLVTVIVVSVVELARLSMIANHFKDMLPVLSLFVIWVISFLFLKIRRERELQGEIADLKDTELLRDSKS